MAKKSKKAEQLKQELISSVPVEQRKMITQPITFSYLNGEMTMMQTRIQTKIMEKLQERIVKALKKNKEQGFVGDLFTSADYNKLPDDNTMYLTFEIRYSEMDVEPAHYDDIDRAVKAMQGIVYEKEVTDEKGARYTDRAVVFNRVRIPNKDRDKGDIERRDSVKLFMLPGVARDLFNLIPYQQYLRDAVSLFSSGYTGRIYLLINANKGLGTWVCPYEKLRRILLTTWDERKKDWVVDKYKEIGDFKKRVLEPAKKEIMDARNRVDCTFDYEFRYPAGKKRGMPEAVVFHIHLTDVGRNIKQRQIEAKAAKEDSPLLTIMLSFGMSTTTAQQVISQMDGRHDVLMTKIQKLQQYIADAKAGKHPKVDDVGGFFATSLENFVKQQKAMQSAELQFTDTAEPAAARQVDAKPVDYAQMMRDGWNNNKE